MKNVLFTLLLTTGFASAAPTTEIEISGIFELRTDEESMEVMGDIVCMQVDEASAPRLPRSPQDQRAPWLCFGNTAQAKAELRIPAQPPTEDCGWRGHATVRVADYDVYQDEGDGYDTARLLTVLRSEAATPIPCNEDRAPE